MRATGLEVADIFRQAGPIYRRDHAATLSRGQYQVMRAIERCRTAALGGHVEQCDACGHQRIAFNSCRNRHCPKCQSLVRAQWLEARQADLLPVEYFHVVFTVPEDIAAISYQNKSVVYEILFHATAETLRIIAADPRHLGAELGFIAILHTWGQNMLHHPHLHCVVPGGGVSADGERWIACRRGFFLPVRVLSRLFRHLFLKRLQQAFDAGELHFFNALAALHAPAVFARHLARARRSEWVVFAKPPFGGPQQVLEYLGRYTHRVAISNNRLVACTDDEVSFRWKDYRHHGRNKVMRLEAHEFIRRFLLHVLPAGFHRIRHYGFLANRLRASALAHCRALLSAPAPEPQTDAPRDYRERYQQLTGRSLRDCPQCGRGHMVCLETFLPGALPRAPPRVPS
ncbi:transposase (plasmid) [Aromatoleum aromaticum EbN1]|uniref:Transposase n=1 Tax=Aromatoleum aromaticum (strain DSM 19018 / LMG 30748 / EbN1) TaxID=76114 RepID=Q5P667_AROAE|nr:IS91-like element ISAzo26 family transposase [Aromatoleum aromaticum]CAI07194.1 transposase [Aromatoleum aromaticum EbN1]CAI10613.1 transposase [Aromatoleum aromaticum EbN1]